MVMVETSPADNVFIVVLEDRHTDPVISVHRTKAGAENRVKEHKKAYRRRYKWGEEAIDDASWIHYERTDVDDGPTVRIQTGVIES
jgi:hypothetical protein